MQTQPPEETSSSPSNGYRILMAEQDAFIRQMSGVKFESAGSAFLGIDNVQDIVDQAIQFKPDLISLGVLFPGDIDGFDAIQKLKSDPRTQNIPVFFLTNLGQEKEVQRGKNLGAAGYLISAEYAPHEVADIYLQYLKDHE